jgi:hypothetical protein
MTQSKSTKTNQTGNADQIVITPDNIDNVVFDGVKVDGVMRTKITSDDPQIEQMFVIDLTDESMQRALQWAFADRRIAFQNGELRNPKRDYTPEWQTKNPTVEVKSIDQWTGERAGKPSDPRDNLWKQYKRGEISRERLIEMLTEME